MPGVLQYKKTTQSEHPQLLAAIGKKVPFSTVWLEENQENNLYIKQQKITSADQQTTRNVKTSPLRAFEIEF